MDYIYFLIRAKHWLCIEVFFTKDYIIFNIKLDVVVVIFYVVVNVFVVVEECLVMGLIMFINLIKLVFRSSLGTLNTELLLGMTYTYIWDILGPEDNRIKDERYRISVKV